MARAFDKFSITESVELILVRREKIKNVYEKIDGNLLCSIGIMENIKYQPVEEWTRILRYGQTEFLNKHYDLTGLENELTLILKSSVLILKLLLTTKV